MFAKGWVLIGPENPIVLVAVDWCEIRNDAYDRWRKLIAEAADTLPERVLVTSVHQHDAPLADLEAQRIVEQHGIKTSVVDLEFHERTVKNVADAVRASLKTAQPVTHYGIGQAKVERIASNRRYLDKDGTPRHNRTSATVPGYATEQPEGTIDPWLKTLSFWNGDRPLVATSTYATHPMAYWGTGRVSADFPGLARAHRQQDMPDVLQIYMSGASGNVTAGKYNDGAPQRRPELADRLYQAMVAAWKATERHPLEQISFRVAPLTVMPRTSSGFSVEELERTLTTSKNPAETNKAALGLSWHKRAAQGRGLIIPVIDFGAAQFVLLPGESYVEFQLLAQKLRPDSFVMVAGYGECATGYVPIERAWEEKDANLSASGGWCWIEPRAEQEMVKALESILTPKSN